MRRNLSSSSGGSPHGEEPAIHLRREVPRCQGWVSESGPSLPCGALRYPRPSVCGLTASWTWLRPAWPTARGGRGGSRRKLVESRCKAASRVHHRQGAGKPYWPFLVASQVSQAAWGTCSPSSREPLSGLSLRGMSRSNGRRKPPLQLEAKSAPVAARQYLGRGQSW